MLAATSLASLAEKSLANYVLGGGLLPLNNNIAFIRDSTAVIVAIVDQKDRAVACGAVSMYSAKQAYCVLGEVSDEYRNKTVWMEEVPSEKKESRTYRITRSVPRIIAHTAPTMFETVFADHSGRPTLLHLVDALVDCSVGKINLDLNKNLTVDLLEGNEKELVGQWRDLSGFVVSDKFRFEEILIERSRLANLKPFESSIVIERADNENILPVLDYDGEVSIYDRTEHVTALLHTPGISGNVALRDGQPCGYTLACKNRILLCYADNEEVFRQLISSIAESMNHPKCKMFVRNGAHDVIQHIIEASIERKTVTRLHTRTNVHGIKWNMIYCANVGLHIF
ncbi:hypothetical protein RB195_026311 [Necator americanus]|uniref:DUF7596 domain-containing protein n=1 Tax=Necator americanus TaxID=51031 RepID=A0ABR1EWF1_NECAM